MSIDVLQDKIRKKKNPSAVLFEAFPELIPQLFLESNETLADACRVYFCRLLEGLKSIVPAVRFDFGSFAILGERGACALSACIATAESLGYYVIVDLPALLSPAAAQNAVQQLLGADSFRGHGFTVGSYLGSDVLRPVQQLCRKGTSVFAVVRTSNKSAVEMQDLLTGGRLVHTAVADVVNRHGESITGKCGYSQLGAVAAAGAADSLRTLRSKYTKLFLLVDGYDYPNGNAKNCSYAFDRFGHGAIVCAGGSITGAWRETGSEDCVASAVEAAERMKKNLTRYVSVL